MSLLSCCSALLSAANEICAKSNVIDEEADEVKETTWKTISDLIGCTYESNKVSALSICNALLCLAVSDSCSDRNAYVSRIIELDKEIQMVLMQIIKKGEMMKNPQILRSPHPDESYLLDDLNIDEDNESLLDDEDDVTNKENIKNRSPLSMSSSASMSKKTPRSFRSPKFSYRSPLVSTTGERSFGPFSGSRRLNTSPLTVSPHKNSRGRLSQLEKETVQLKDTNEALCSELNMFRQQESELRALLEENEAKNRAAQLKIETEHLALNNKLRDEYDDKIQSLERKLKRSEEKLENKLSLEEEVSALKDEVDVLQSCKTKLMQTEDQLRKMKAKVEQMNDMSTVLASEEKAHAEAVAKCLELENNLAVLAPLKRQLEEYKSRATDAEVRLVDCEDEIKRLKESGNNMSDLNKELKVDALRQQAEVEDMRRQMHEGCIDSFDEDNNKLGQGISEMNPVLKEELLRLRSENKRLKEFAAKREDDAVQILEEKCDDASRLSAKFKEQFLSTKSVLEEHKGLLNASMNRENELKLQVENLLNDIENLKSVLEDEREASALKEKEASELLLTTKKTMSEEHDLRLSETIHKWTSELEKVQSEWNKKYDSIILESNEKEREHHNEVSQLKDEMSKAIKEMEIQNQQQLDAKDLRHQEQLHTIKEETMKEKEELITKGKQMIHSIRKEKDEKIISLEDAINEISEEQQSLIVKQKEYEQKVSTKLSSYKKKLSVAQTEVQEATSENEDLQMKLKKIEREKATLQDENDRFRRQMNGRMGFDQGQYEVLQREYNLLLEENQSLKNSVGADGMFSDRNPSSYLSGEKMSFTSGNNIHASLVSQIREDYESKIEELNDEKRQLVMKNSALITEEKRAVNRTWDLEVQVKDLQEKNTSLQLQVERLERMNMSTSKKRIPSKASPRSLTKRSGAWKKSRQSPGKYNFDSMPSPTTSTIPNLDKKSPEFENSMSNFRSKLITRLSSGKKLKKHKPLVSSSNDDGWEFHL